PRPMEVTWPTNTEPVGADQTQDFGTIFSRGTTFAPAPTEIETSSTIIPPSTRTVFAPPGPPLQKQTSALPSKFCTACGAWNPNTNRVCQTCGQRLAVFCQNCGSRNLPSGQYCRVCGLKFDPGTENAVSASVVGSRFVHYLRRIVRTSWRSRQVASDDLYRFPFVRERGGYEARVALVESFRFVHEPINESSAFRFVGRQS